MSISSQEQFMPWMQKPYEYIFHAETHYRDSSDYSKRMSYISFDNAIEVSINTIIHRKKDKEKGIFVKKEEIKDAKNYIQKLIFFEEHIQSKGLPIISSIKQGHETTLFIASILGGWNENSQGDSDIIKAVDYGSEKMDK